jgi:hypothetical protein
MFTSSLGCDKPFPLAEHGSALALYIEKGRTCIISEGEIGVILKREQ